MGLLFSHESRAFHPAVQTRGMICFYHCTFQAPTKHTDHGQEDLVLDYSGKLAGGPFGITDGQNRWLREVFNHFCTQTGSMKC